LTSSRAGASTGARGAGRGFERSEFAAFGIPGEESAPRFHETVDIVLKAWSNERLSYDGKFYKYDGVEVLPKPLQSPMPVWMAASSTPAIDWAASQGYSILMDPHSSRQDLIGKRRHYAAKLAEAGHSVDGRTIPMARLIAVDEDAAKAREVAKRTAEWTVAAYVGPKHTANVRQEVRTFGGKDPVDYYLDDVMFHGTPDSVADQIRAFSAESGMTYMMAAPMSGRSFRLLTDKVLPKLTTEV
jgi:alkanesulfonate monooxygenase SsuD/methylene tetrahydromethanopterin reductase-like flavin-dependent oxidoreductase (luciferase family)